MDLTIRKQIFYVLLFVAALLIQIAATKYFPNFPDISLLVIIFGGIYFFGIEILFIVVLVSFIRNFFSQETMAVDAFLMPCICAMAYLFSKMFNRQNVFFQILITFISLFLIITVHSLFFRISTGNHIAVGNLISASWKKIFLTGISAPFFFLIYREYFRIRW